MAELTCELLTHVILLVEVTPLHAQASGNAPFVEAIADGAYKFDTSLVVLVHPGAAGEPERPLERPLRRQRIQLCHQIHAQPVDAASSVAVLHWSTAAKAATGSGQTVGLA